MKSSILEQLQPDATARASSACVETVRGASRVVLCAVRVMGHQKKSLEVMGRDVEGLASDVRLKAGPKS